MTVMKRNGKLFGQIHDILIDPLTHEPVAAHIYRIDTKQLERIPWEWLEPRGSTYQLRVGQGELSLYTAAPTLPRHRHAGS